MSTSHLPASILDKLQSKTPVLWINEGQGQPLPPDHPPLNLIEQAQARMSRCAPLLAGLFPELAASGGYIESDLMPSPALREMLGFATQDDSAWFLKRDDELPVAGSIKARGGFHEVLAIAEQIALNEGLLATDGDRLILASPAAKASFSQYTVAVGSTGNLGLSIGVIAAALGFDAVVHIYGQPEFCNLWF